MKSVFSYLIIVRTLALQIVFLGVVGLTNCLAEDIKLADGRILREAKVTRVEPDGLRIIHADGFTKVSHESLPDDLKAKYNFDTEKADAFRKQSATEQSESQKRMREEREKSREMELATFAKVKEEAAKTPRLTETDSIKAFWIRSLPRPTNSLDRDYSRKVKFALYMTEQIRAGEHDLEAESAALQWNIKELIRVGKIEESKGFSDQLIAVKQQISERDRLRQEAELKRQEFALKQQELGLQAMGIASMQDMSTALNRIAFQMLLGNAIDAQANGMTLNYWEVSR